MRNNHLWFFKALLFWHLYYSTFIHILNNIAPSIFSSTFVIRIGMLPSPIYFTVAPMSSLCWKMITVTVLFSSSSEKKRKIEVNKSKALSKKKASDKSLVVLIHTKEIPFLANRSIFLFFFWGNEYLMTGFDEPGVRSVGRSTVRKSLGRRSSSSPVLFVLTLSF